MIFVLLGTIQFEFVRPLKDIESLCKKGIIKEEVIVQAGYTKFDSEYLKIIPFIEPSEMDKLIEKASLIITHGGTGSVLKALKKRKKIIAVARYQELKEHVDDHQLELLAEFSKNNYLIPWFKDDNLEKILEKVKVFEPNPYYSQKDKIINYIENYINNI